MGSDAEWNGRKAKLKCYPQNEDHHKDVFPEIIRYSDYKNNPSIADGYVGDPVYAIEYWGDIAILNEM